MDASSSTARRALVTVLDILLFAGVIALPLAWLFDPLRITWGPLNTTLSWGWKPVVIPALVLAARIALVRGPSRGFGLFHYKRCQSYSFDGVSTSLRGRCSYAR